MMESCTTKMNAKTDEPKETGKNWFQILAIISACVAGFMSGLLFSWPSPSIPKIVNDKDNYNISPSEASYFSVLPPISAIVSSLLFTKLNDLIGRKYTLLLVFVPQVLSLILIAAAKSVYVLYISRLISGLADACVYASVPMYIGETATPQVRGVWGNFLSFSIYFGQLVVNVVGSYTTITTSACICLTFPLVFICTFVWMPETPYFYLMKNRADDARTSLRKLRRKRNVEDELEQLRMDVVRQMSERGTWKDVFAIESNRKAIYAGIFLRTSQQCSGISAFMVYTQYIFAKAGGNLSASSSAIIFTGLCSVLNVCAGFTLDKIGRKKSYFWSTLACGVVLLCESVFFFLEQFCPKINLTAVNWIPLLGMILYMIFYSFGLGIVPTLMLGELFSTSIKTKGLTLLMMVYSVLISSITKIFYFLDAEFGLFAPFLFFSVSCFISTILVLYFVPETKGRTLEQIQQDLKGANEGDR
ncbi:unnamed protein product [Tenebrio molitor]|jgi:MFS family permease|nr:unnamed protein product [Tenebrio molitor]